MDRKNELMEIVSNLNSKTIAKYNNDYYFQDVLDDLDENDVKDIFDKFLLSYFARVSYLFNNYDKESKKFLKWFTNVGSEKILPIFGALDFKKINVKRLVKLLTNYDVIMEQSIDEDDVDCLLDTLIDIPLGFYLKMEEWNCFKVEEKLNEKDYFEPYKSNELNSLSIWMPAEMQVSLL
ncbi:hypothetical protein ACV3RG_13030 [Clostridium perfringens]|nr:hypothetical protein [Clostridium perfringens]